MTGHQPTSTPPGRQQRLVRVRGVHATPGGWVRVSELVDGWASFPDQRAGNRRMLGIGTVLLLALLAALIVAERTGAPVGVQQALGWPLLFGFVALIVVDEIADDRATALRWRSRMDSMKRAGGRDALRQAVRHHGRARTVGEMNILLSSLGRTDPVYSRRRVRQATVRRRGFRTTVEVELTTGQHLAYRVSGLRAPMKLARIFTAQPD